MFELEFGEKANQLLSNKSLHPVDLFFAKRLYPEGLDEPFLFLAYLLASAREGHLCVSAINGRLSPTLGSEWDERLCAGASRLPARLFDRFIIRFENHYYLKRHWECEQRFMKEWSRLKQETPFHPISPEWLLGELEKESLEPEQKAAILKAASQTLTVICGGPGTGKTFTAYTLVRLFRQAFKGEVALAAPTGKAVANLRMAQEKSDPAGLTIDTLHTLLKKRYLSADLVLVDESSMVDAELMASLFEAVKEGARLILLGDKDQLPPVESGNFFADLSADPMHTAELSRCLRTDLEEIVALARNVKKGNPVPFQPLPNLKALIAGIANKLPLTEEMSPKLEKLYQAFRVLCPLRQGLFGIDHLNALLKEEHLLAARRARVEKIAFPIMITANDPSIGLFNGDTGFFVEADRSAYFGDRKIPDHLLPRYEYAYVLSVHKSQGSEYRDVWILLPKGSEVFGKEMLYTAVTRAKRSVEIYADASPLTSILSKHSQRLSGIDYH